MGGDNLERFCKAFFTSTVFPLENRVLYGNVYLMMKPRGLSVKGRAYRLSLGRPHRVQSADALSLV